MTATEPSTLLRTYLRSERGRSTPKEVRERLRAGFKAESPLKSMTTTTAGVHALRVVVESCWRDQEFGKGTPEAVALDAELDALLAAHRGHRAHAEARA